MILFFLVDFHLDRSLKWIEQNIYIWGLNDGHTVGFCGRTCRLCYLILNQHWFISTSRFTLWETLFICFALVWGGDVCSVWRCSPAAPLGPSQSLIWPPGNYVLQSRTEGKSRLCLSVPLVSCRDADQPIRRSGTQRGSKGERNVSTSQSETKSHGFRCDWFACCPWMDY